MRQELFGKVRLGYVLVESERRQEWRKFAGDALGIQVDEVGDQVLAMRVDAHERRIVVRPGPAEDVVALGWQVDDEQTLEELVARLSSRGVRVVREHADAALRGVKNYVMFEGPKKFRMELFTAPKLSGEPLKLSNSGFVTGASGLGHVAIFTQEPEAFERFWQEVFDARLSDRIEDKLGGQMLDFAFFRLNERHHSVALASTRGRRMNPLRSSIHHLNLQAASFDDVAQAYLRCRAMGYSIANAIGQHPNDKELSFYVVSPSGFEVELGWNPILVDEQKWQVCSYRGISLWGHFKENLSLGMQVKQAARGIASLRHQEYVLPPFRD